MPSAGHIPSLSLSFVFYEMRTIQMCAFLAVGKFLEADRCRWNASPGQHARWWLPQRPASVPASDNCTAGL